MRFLPVAGAVLFAVPAALFERLEYARLIANQQWTSATITIGLAIFLTAVAAVLGWFLGRSVRELIEPGGDREQGALITACILVFTGYASWSMAAGRAREVRFDEISREEMTVSRAEAIVASGDREDIRALAYNFTCPPAILRQFALSSDEVVRAHTAMNQATPPEVVASLTKDPSEDVRWYASFYLPRRRAQAQ